MAAQPEAILQRTGAIAVHVTLPWPHKDLWQNTGAHWAAKGRATAKARRDAFYAAKAATCFRAVRDAKCTGYALSFDFCPPNRRRRDIANAQAAMKAAIDGIADALGVDDSTFRIEWPTEWGTVADDGGSVMVVIRPIRTSVGGSA